MASNICMLSTIDNPYNPFEDFTSWWLYDNACGYNSCGYLARVAVITDDMSSVEEDMETERAINEIIKSDPIGLYIKVTKGMKEDETSTLETDDGAE